MNDVNILSSLHRWRGIRRILGSGVIVAALALSGCVGGSSSGRVSTLSSFIGLVRLGDFDLSNVTAVQYTIAPKPGAVLRTPDATPVGTLGHSHWMI
jgi:hypothetical protein